MHSFCCGAVPGSGLSLGRRQGTARAECMHRCHSLATMEVGEGPSSCLTVCLEELWPAGRSVGVAGPHYILNRG